MKRYMANGTGKMAARTKNGFKLFHSSPTATVNGGRVTSLPTPRRYRQKSIQDFLLTEAISATQHPPQAAGRTSRPPGSPRVNPILTSDL
jgi:hypothetical protein